MLRPEKAPAQSSQVSSARREFGRIIAEYDYADENGEVLFQAVRLEPKDFRQRRPATEADREADAQRPAGEKPRVKAGGWVWSIEGVRQVPYRLAELLSMEGRGRVYLCEGEKDADRLAAMGLQATTNAMGAGKWPAGLLEHFSGFDVVILPDHDDAGEAHVRTVAPELVRHAKSVRVLRLPGLREKGDASDWLDAGGDAEALERLADRAERWGREGALLNTIDPSQWKDDAAPARVWAWDGYMPLGQATYLTGAGAAGKSLLAQQAATCAALGRPLLGVEMRQATSLYVTCEDDVEELYRRQDAINYALQITMADLAGKLHLCSLAGQTGNELCLFDRDGVMQTTPAWGRLRETVRDLDVGFIALDNIAHQYGGDEIRRSQVAAYCSLMNGLAVEGRKRAVLFIGHPNKNGDAYSGSTAWENQVRSRLFLARAKGEGDGPAIDPDLRTLSREKANYAQKGGDLSFRWWRWAFVRDDDLPNGEGAALALHLQTKADDERFLSCLAKATAERRATSTARAASNYAPRLFAAMPGAGGVTLERFTRAMEGLLHEGVIQADQPVYRRPNRTWAHGLAPAQTPAQTDAQRRTDRVGEP